MKHPNSNVAGSLTGAALIVSWLASLFGVDMPDIVAIAIVGVTITLALRVGRRKT